jgi:hypothetical protein
MFSPFVPPPFPVWISLISYGSKIYIIFAAKFNGANPVFAEKKTLFETDAKN